MIEFIFTRGYGEVKDRLIKNSKYLMSCYNCDYFYKTHNDNEELCQNSEVLPYDIIVSEKAIYCSLWKPALSKKDTSIRMILKKGDNKNEL